MNEESYNQSFFDRLTDYGAETWPWVTNCQAAGNSSHVGYVVHKGFNSIVVGANVSSSQMHIESHAANGSGGQELPHVTAIAGGVSPLEELDGTTPKVVAGTSVAAAEMTGFVANLQQYESLFKYWPEATRAVVMASGRNVDGSNWTSTYSNHADGKDGTGMPDAGIAKGMAANVSYGSGTFGSKGVNAGSFSQFDQNGRTFAITHTGGKLRIVLSWTAHTTGTNYSAQSLTDLDLYLDYSTGGGVFPIGYSASAANPYEVIEKDLPAATYSISVLPYSSPSYTQYYSVAWTSLPSW